MKKALPRAQIELCYQKATRGDDGNALKGELCRGEFLEILLRFVKQLHQSDKKISIFIKEFLTNYIEPLYKQSKIISTRKLIHSHK